MILHLNKKICSNIPCIVKYPCIWAHVYIVHVLGVFSSDYLDVRSVKKQTLIDFYSVIYNEGMLWSNQHEIWQAFYQIWTTNSIFICIVVNQIPNAFYLIICQYYTHLQP